MVTNFRVPGGNSSTGAMTWRAMVIFYA